jgi:hypothetical protein
VENLDRSQETRRKRSKKADSSPIIIFKHTSSTESEQDRQKPSAFQFMHHIAPDAHLISPLLTHAALAPSLCLYGRRSTQQEPEDDDVTHQ